MNNAPIASGMDPYDKPIDTLVIAGNLLRNPRWAKIWNQLRILGNIHNEDPDVNLFLSDGVTVEELSEWTGISEDTLAEDLEDLVDLDAVEVKSEGSPRGYESRWFQIEVQEMGLMGETEHVTMEIFGVIGYGYNHSGVEEFIEKYGYTQLNDCVIAYREVLQEDGAFHTLSEVFPSIPAEDIGLIKEAIDYAYREVSDDPLWNWEYPEWGSGIE